MKSLLFALSFIHSSLACLPTQQVEPTTTTTTTTTVAPEPNPCTVCAPLYIDDCSDGGIECVIQSLIGVIYKKGPLLGFPLPFGDPDTCSTFFTCPFPTVPYVRWPIINIYAPAPVPGPVIATCQESGPDAGKWYYGIPPFTVPVEINGLTCQGIFSG